MIYGLNVGLYQRLNHHIKCLQQQGPVPEYLNFKTDANHFKNNMSLAKYSG